MLLQVGQGHACLLMLRLPLLEHAHHLLLGSGELRAEVLILSLQSLHLLGHLIWRVADDLIHIHDSLDLFGFGAEVQRLFGFLIVGEGLAHGADDGGHGVP